jgi:hypothetical protein
MHALTLAAPHPCVCLQDLALLAAQLVQLKEQAGEQPCLGVLFTREA